MLGRLWRVFCGVGRAARCTSHLIERLLMFGFAGLFLLTEIVCGVSGIRGIYHTKMHLIPIKEMVATVTVSKVNATAMAKGWARCKRGKYKGDIVQIISVDNNKNEIEVRMVPRVDTTDYSQFDESEAKKRRAKFVPSRRLFKPEDYSTDDLLKWGIERIRDEDLENVYVYQGMKFETFAGDSDSSTGFLKNRWPVKSLQIGSEVVPQLDELKLFEQASEEQEGGGSSFQHLTNVHKRKIVLQKGDIVRVKEGEFPLSTRHPRVVSQHLLDAAIS